eukprot:5016361-Ditylum_brightwellii.AAC.1
MSKRQGMIETSTYGTEFCAIRTAVEEVQAIHVVLNSTVSDSLLKKKHVAIAYHKTREAAASRMIHPIKVALGENFAGLLTKALTGKIFWRLY